MEWFGLGAIGIISNCKGWRIKFPTDTWTGEMFDLRESNRATAHPTMPLGLPIQIYCKSIVKQSISMEGWGIKFDPDTWTR